MGFRLAVLTAVVLAIEAVLLALPLARAGWAPARVVLFAAALDALLVGGLVVAFRCRLTDRDVMSMYSAAMVTYMIMTLTIGLAAVGALGVYYFSI